MKTFQLSFLVLAALIALPVASGLLLDEGCDHLSICPTDYAPVCGSNGHTYTSVCQLKKVACKTCDEKLHVVAEGVCPQETFQASAPRALRSSVDSA